MSSDRIHNEHCRPQSIGSKKITPRFSSSGSRNVVQFHTFCTKKQVLLISLLTVLFCLVRSGMQYQRLQWVTIWPIFFPWAAEF